MRVAIIGASGKMGTRLVIESLQRGYQVVAVCRDASSHKMDSFVSHDRCTVATAPVVSDGAMLRHALAGCDAVVAVLITVRNLRATELVTSLDKATGANGVKRIVFTAGEVTAVPEDGEIFTTRQRLLKGLGRMISWITPYSMNDMVKASAMVWEQSEWDWTILRAPKLRATPATGYRFCQLSEVSSRHFLSREDYAVCLLDSLGKTEHHRRTLTVVSAGE